LKVLGATLIKLIGYVLNEHLLSFVSIRGLPLVKSAQNDFTTSSCLTFRGFSPVFTRRQKRQTRNPFDFKGSFCPSEKVRNISGYAQNRQNIHQHILLARNHLPKPPKPGFPATASKQRFFPAQEFIIPNNHSYFITRIFRSSLREDTNFLDLP